MVVNLYSFSFVQKFVHGRVSSMAVFNEAKRQVPTPVSYKAGVFKKISYVIALSRYIAEQERINVFIQYSEILWLYVTRQLGPLLYYEVSLWKRDVSLKDKMRYLNAAQYKKRINELNPELYRKFSNDKLAEKAILTLLGIPTADFVGFLHPFNGTDSKSLALTNAKDLERLLTLHIGKKLCFKLTEGWGGEGFIAVLVSEKNSQVHLTILPEKKQSADNIDMGVNDFFTRHLQQNYLRGLLIELYIEQHPTVKALNVTSVNTLRMWVIQHKDKVKFIGALLRIGGENQIVDNTTQSGIFCLIDQSTGRVTTGRNNNIIPEFFDLHPDTGAQLTGVQLPFWSECIILGKLALRVFPHTNFVGLDIAFSTTGPLIVELNQEPDKVSARIFEGSLTELLDNDNID